MNGNELIYEQPLSELVRASLRLEHLFNQIDTCLFSCDVEQHTHTIIRSLVDILNILDRPDLKAKLSKEFSRIQAYFMRLQSMPKISHEKLDDTLKKINRLTEYFTESHGKIAQELRDNDFLSIIRQNLLSSGGGSSVDTPGYYFWLNQPSGIRQQQIHMWLNEFTEIRSATELLLSIIRDSSEPKQVTADHGFYHETLDRQSGSGLRKFWYWVKQKLGSDQVIS